MLQVIPEKCISLQIMYCQVLSVPEQKTESSSIPEKRIGFLRHCHLQLHQQSTHHPIVEIHCCSSTISGSPHYETAIIKRMKWCKKMDHQTLLEGCQGWPLNVGLVIDVFTLKTKMINKTPSRLHDLMDHLYMIFTFATVKSWGWLKRLLKFTTEILDQMQMF